MKDREPGKRKMTSRKKYGLIVLLIMLFIFIQSALPGDMSGRESGMIAAFLVKFFPWDPEVIFYAVRKGAHFTEFALLGISLFLYFRECFRERRKREKRPRGRAGDTGILYAAAWIAGTFYAFTDEFHQLFVQGRSGELRDVLIDSAGVLAGVLLTGFFCGTGGIEQKGQPDPPKENNFSKRIIFPDKKRNA